MALDKIPNPFENTLFQKITGEMRNKLYLLSLSFALLSLLVAVIIPIVLLFPGTTSFFGKMFYGLTLCICTILIFLFLIVEFLALLMVFYSAKQSIGILINKDEFSDLESRIKTKAIINNLLLILVSTALFLIFGNWMLPFVKFTIDFVYLGLEMGAI